MTSTKLFKAKATNIFIFNLICFNIILMAVLTPFINALIFDFESQGIKINFGIARGMGSASYAIASLVMGDLTATYETNWLPYLYAFLAVITTVSVITFKSATPVMNAEIDNSKVNLKEENKQNFFVKYPLLTKTSIAVILIFFGFNLTNSYLIQIVRNVGGYQFHLGIAMFLGAIVELPAMAMSNILAKKIERYNVMNISAIFFGIKHTLLWLAPNLTIIYIAQLL